MIEIDEEGGTVTVVGPDGSRTSLPMDSAEAFEAVSRAWLRCGWDAKHVYSFTWMGRPIIQLPEDMVRLQEVIHAVKPDLLIETGVAHGGSLVFYASLFAAMGKGRVVGVDIEIRPHNRTAIEAHPLSRLVTLIEGSSIDPATVARVRAQVRAEDKVMVVLDSNHTRDHVLAELDAYAPQVSVGSYIVACDGIMRDLRGAPRTKPDWQWNNPTQAARDFVARHSDFAIEPPPFAFNEGSVKRAVTYWPDGYIRRLR